MSDLIPAWSEGRLMPMDKLEVHQRGLRHKAVSVFVLRDGLLLLQRRASGKYHTPGLWANSCCTHPHWEESPQACAQRRLQEELGLERLDLRHKAVIEYRAEVGGGLVEHELVDIFLAEAPQGVEPRPDPAEVMGTRWIGLDMLRGELESAPESFTPWLHIYMNQHCDLIFGPRAAGALLQ